MGSYIGHWVAQVFLLHCRCQPPLSRSPAGLPWGAMPAQVFHWLMVGFSFTRHYCRRHRLPPASLLIMTGIFFHPPPPRRRLAYAAGWFSHVCRWLSLFRDRGIFWPRHAACFPPAAACLACQRCHAFKWRGEGLFFSACSAHAAFFFWPACLAALQPASRPACSETHQLPAMERV